MGQANSRNSTSSPSVSRSQPPPPHPSFPHSSQSALRDDIDTSNTSTLPSTKASRRSPVRQSVCSFLRPRIHSDSPSPSSLRQIPAFHKRWRPLKRFAKTQAPLPNLSEAFPEPDRPPALSTAAVDAQLTMVEEQPIQTESSSAPLQSLLLPASGPTVLHSSRAEPPHDPGAEAVLVDDCRSSQDHVSPSVVEEPPPSKIDIVKPDAPPLYLEPHESAHQIEREINDFLLEHPRQDSLFVEGSSQDGQISDAPEPSPIISLNPLPDTAGAADPQTQTPRHFPPPGTLVVVQGVVNTSDNTTTAQSPPSGRATRPSSTANSTPSYTSSSRRASSLPREERQSARSRLSALLPRPPSMLGRRSLPSNPSAEALHTSQSTSDLSSTALESVASSDLLTDASDLSSAPVTEARSGEDVDFGSRPLSPGSIDVLGTLLSVAAAAAAASLFSPSLGFQANSDPNAPAQPTSAIPRPMSPTPTAGLGGGPGFHVAQDYGSDAAAPISSTPSPTPQQRDGRDRIRNVWESFRDRLGLTRNALPQGSGGASSTENGGNMRPGEIMLAEMARALNVGLGLTDDNANADTTEAPADRAEVAQSDGVRAREMSPSTRPPPPEDSFERFLLDLQADLRVALSETGTGGPTASTAISNPGNEEAPVASSSDIPNSADIVDVEARSSSLAIDEEELPPLDDICDTEVDGHDGMDQTSTRIATPMPSGRELPNRSYQPTTGSSRTQDDGRGDAEQRPPGIHLWRLYRFRPIHATQIAGHASSTTPPTAAVFPQSSAPVPNPLSPSAQAEGSPHPVSESDASTGLPPSFASTSSPLPNTSAERDGAESPSSAPPATDPNANMVVPVIVVGLQSVEMGQVQGHAQGHATHHHNTHHPNDHEPEETPLPEPDDWASGRLDDSSFRAGGSADADQMGDATPRGRTWQSRAANALRNLRPGRRNVQEGEQAAEGTGSRTFLIYVIGGYYPPNHHMVTGPDNLDSYEALWELTELLGQVKPQVATREDIEKSDLETFKCTELGWYEREGRVASNCVDRCLICLDDYQPEDDVRLMHCRHAFHKDCVDKWMQVGRNNCPACRTEGVSTSDKLVP
ncbi:hypothetical protein BC628DRAFT_1385679 [Trametes gibbosa]|uniref:RING-type E3 ubiquitin transferase n=1 Tax=Trametes gibbosa TaxID=160864 RepID=A0A6G6FQR7_9APHY|nr:hypothetical protein BC628DRAFT_1385679 [Trametes gibbosa]QIE48577.1 hypothetical protein [Trametes gibbosa]